MTSTEYSGSDTIFGGEDTDKINVDLNLITCCWHHHFK